MRIDKICVLGPVLVDALLSIPPADDAERLGPVLVDALLSIPPADDDVRLGPVLVDALLSIPPARLWLVMRHWGQYWRMPCSRYREWD